MTHPPKLWTRWRKRLGRVWELARVRPWTFLSAVAWPLAWPAAWLWRRTWLRGTRLIAVTGSFGKTSTAAADGGRARRAVRSARRATSAAFSPWRSCATALADRPLVLEVGISRRGQMHRYARLLRPDVVLLTAVAEDHSQGLGGIDGVAAEKARLAHAVRPGRAPGGQRRRSAVPRDRLPKPRANAVRVGFAADCEWRIDSVRVEFPRGTHVGLAGPDRGLEITSPWIGEGLARCTAVAAAVGAASGLGDDTVRERLAGLRPIPERLETVALPAGAWLLCDSWKSTWVTIESALHELGRLAGWRRIAVLGNIDEVRGDADRRSTWSTPGWPRQSPNGSSILVDGFEKFLRGTRQARAGAGPCPGLPRRSSGRRGAARRARAGNRHPGQGGPPAEAGPDQASPAG